MKILGTLVLLLTAVASFGESERPQAAVRLQDEFACIVMNTERLPLAERRSSLDSLTFGVQGSPVKICYSRPSAREREIMGGLLPYGELWRTGANEATMIHTPIALEIAGISVGPGSYSLYTVPGETEWEVVVNGSTTQWGHERYYTGDVAAQEIARATVPAGATDEFVEMFTIRAVPADGGDATVILEWERTRVEIPIAPARAAPNVPPRATAIRCSPAPP
jgi:hypothetical protein